MPQRPGVLAVIGSGINSVAQFSRESEAYLRWADRVFYLVWHPIAEEWIRQHAAAAENMTAYYGEDKPRKLTYIQMAERVVEPLGEGLNVCAVFYGHPGVFVTPSHVAIRLAREAGHEAFMLPGVSALDCLFADLAVDPGEGCQIVEATDLLLHDRKILRDNHLIVLQIGSVGDLRFSRAGFDTSHFPLLINRLRDEYGDSHEAVHYIAARYPFAKAMIRRARLIDFLRDEEVVKLQAVSTLYVAPKDVVRVNDQVAEVFDRPSNRSKDADSTVPATGRELPPGSVIRPKQAVYDLVLDMIADPGLRVRYLTDPDGVLESYSDLTPRDREVIRALSG
ncbi:MAG: hypothetical protein QOH16_687 [Gaiellaceae bacterium]|nr:hypothetical protein [Gaiellaceae bacterium]